MITLIVTFPKINIFLWRIVSTVKYNNTLATYSAFMCLGTIIIQKSHSVLDWRLKYFLIQCNVYLPQTSDKTGSTSAKTKTTITPTCESVTCSNNQPTKINLLRFVSRSNLNSFKSKFHHEKYCSSIETSNELLSIFICLCSFRLWSFIYYFRVLPSLLEGPWNCSVFQSIKF